MDKTSAYTLRTYTAGATSVLTSRLSNEFRFNYSSNATTNDTVIDAIGGSTPVNLSQLAGLGRGSTLQISPCYDAYCVELLQGSVAGVQRQWNLVDAMGLSLGRHQLKFGADYRRLSPVAVLNSPLAGYYYLGETSVEMNSAGFVILQAVAPAYPLYTNFSAFAQDEWKVSQRLNLSFGLRWEVNPAPGVTQGLKPYTFQGSSASTWALAPQGTPLWRTTWYNFAPRLGVAYVLHNDPARETVVRAGGGIFFDTGQQLGSLGFGGPGFSAATFTSGSFPCSPAPCSIATMVPSITNPPVAPYVGTLYVFPQHLQLPYTLQWNASIEQALGKSQALTVSYVGSHAARLLKLSIINTPDNPNASQFFFLDNGFTSDYDSLQIQLRRRLSRGLTALASYSWSHCLDYGSQNISFGYQRGNCDFDVRHNFSAAFSYDVPNVGHNNVANAVLHHWGLDDRFTARTAFPVTLGGNQLVQPNGQIYNAGLDFVSGQPVYIYGTECAKVYAALFQNTLPCPGGRAINPNAFVNVTSGLGDAPRNFAQRLWGLANEFSRSSRISDS